MAYFPQYGTLISQRKARMQAECVSYRLLASA